MVLQRYLDGFEESRQAPAMNALSYTGDVHEEALRQAFDALCSRYPVLHGCIRSNDGGTLLHVPRNHKADFVAIDGDRNTLLQEYMRPFDLSRGAAKLLLIREGNSGHVALRFSHAILNHAGVKVIWRDLLDLYSDIVAGVNPSPAPGNTLPRSPYEILKERWWNETELPMRSKQIVHSFKESNGIDVAGQNTLLLKHVRFSVEETDRIIEYSRAYKVSVNFLIGATIAHAFAACGSTSIAPIIAIETNVSLRNRVTPHVGPMEATNLNGRHWSKVRIHRDTREHETAWEYQKQLVQGIADKRIYVPGIDYDEKVCYERFPRSATDYNILINNVGMEQKLTSNHLNVTDWLTAPEILCQLTSTRTKKGAGKESLSHHFRTYDGNLSVCLIYTSGRLGPLQMERIVEDICKRLCSL